MAADMAVREYGGPVGNALANAAEDEAKEAVDDLKKEIAGQDTNSDPSSDEALERAGIIVTKRIPNSKLKGPPPARGRAPIGSDGKPVELHHPDQEDTNEREELTRTDHRGPGNFSENHENTGQEPSKIDRNKTRREHTQHWRDEWDRGRFKKMKPGPK
jgi:hypothetical protein